MKNLTRRELLAMTSVGVAGSCIPEAFASVAQAIPNNSLSPKRPMNVLFIAVDDLRPQMNCYGEKQMVTPNLDKLAAGSAMFRSNYCQQAVCSPSRTSMLTGCRPDTTKVYDLIKFFRETLPNVVTLPQHFKKHGYFAEAVGKIFHEDLNDPASWSIPAAFDTSAEELEQYQLRESYHEEAERLHQIPRHGLVYGPPFEAVDAPEDGYLDGRIATEAIRRLKIQGSKKLDMPFFLAVGFHKPHLPFVCPRKYWDMYDRNKIELPGYREKPKGAADLVMTHSDELRPYYGIPLNQEPLSDSLSRELIHGYYAGVSFTDAQIGRVLTALEQEGFADDTIVVLVVDHGWHLADHGLFCKHTNFEHATHVPMMVRSPGMASSQIDGLIENIDIYPTLCELAGLHAPEHLEGTSFVPLMRNPERVWKTASFSQYPRPGGIMGYSMRTKRYRYTRWIQTKDQAVVAEELYDYQTDPEETTNWITSHEHADVLSLLRSQSLAGWKAAGPTA